MRLLTTRKRLHTLQPFHQRMNQDIKWLLSGLFFILPFYVALFFSPDGLGSWEFLRPQYPTIPLFVAIWKIRPTEAVDQHNGLWTKMKMLITGWSINTLLTAFIFPIETTFLIGIGTAIGILLQLTL